MAAKVSPILEAQPEPLLNACEVTLKVSIRRGRKGRWLEAHEGDRVVSGHEIEVLPDGYSDSMGHAGAAVLHADGSLEAAHDPRADGGAAGV